MKSVYSPNDYQNLESDSAMIQAAVDEAAKYGATVEIPRFNERTKKCIWELDESIFLHTGSAVVLNNCHLRLMDYKYISFFRNTALKDGDATFRRESRQYDISVRGVGNALLDGGTKLDIREGDFKPFDKKTGKFIGRVVIKGMTDMLPNIGIYFCNVERVNVSGLHFINQRYWGMCFRFCSFGTVKDICFEAMNHVYNQDGVDIRVGCNNFLVDNVYGYIGDDIVALTALEKDVCDKTDMSTDIHHIIIRNIRAHHTGHCDIIRMLNQGGNQIYNVLIDGVMDFSETNNVKRSISAVRIGDLTPYRERINELGELRNIVIRNVSSRARFGVFAANTIADATFDNIRMYGDGGIGIYFNGCEMKNVNVRDLTYDMTSEAPEGDIGFASIFQKVEEIKEMSAVHFNNCKAENVRFDGIVSGKGQSYVFGGNSNIEIRATNVTIADLKTKLTSCARIVE